MNLSESVLDRGMCRGSVESNRMNTSLLDDDEPRKVVGGRGVDKKTIEPPHGGGGIVKDVKCIPPNMDATMQPVIKFDSTSSTVSATSGEFTPTTTDDETASTGRRPSLVLRKVREKIARRKSESSSELDTSHRSQKFDLLEGLDEERGVSGAEPVFEQDGNLVLQKVKAKIARRKSESSLELDVSHRSLKFDLSEGLDEDSETDAEVGLDLTAGTDSQSSEPEEEQDPLPREPTETTACTCSLSRSQLPRIHSAPAVTQSTSFPQPLRRPSCLKDETRRRSLDSNVHFGTIMIREYQRSLADNPAVTEGPPIGLGWKYAPNELSFRVDDYEDCKPTPRKKEEFCMPSQVREDLLLNEWGHTLRDIRRVSNETKVIRQHRERTQRTSRATERVCELFESFKRKWHRLKTRKSKEMELQQLWQHPSISPSVAPSEASSL